MLRRIGIVAAVVAIVALGLVRIPEAGAAPPPTADQDVQDIWNGLDALQSFSQGLGTDGAFGTALTDVGVTPGGADGLGFGDMFKKVLIDRLTSANPTHLADLVSALSASSPVTLEAGGRTATVTVTSSSAGGIESLRFSIIVSRRVASAPMSLNVTSPKFDFAAPVQVDLAFHAAFTVVYDSSARTVYLDTASSPPTMKLAADAHFPCSPVAATMPCTQDASAVRAGVGVLGVSLASGSSFDLTTNLKASLRDPNGDGKVTLGTYAGGSFNVFAEPNGSGGTNPGELDGGAAAAAGLVNVSSDTNPGALHAQLNLAASVDPSLSSVTLPSVNAGVQIDWADISTGSPAVSVTGAGLATVQSFQNLSPRDLAQGLARLATALEGIQMSRTYTATSGGKTGTTAAIADGDATSTYTAVGGGAPAAGDFLRIGGANGQVREVDKVVGSGPYTLTLSSPVNGAVAAATAMTQVDANGNIDLPFMKGTIADVFQANEAIVAFLNQHVHQKYNSMLGGRTGTLSAVSGQTATYSVVAGGAPQTGDYYTVGSITKKVTAVSGTGPYALTLDTAFNPAPSDGTAAVQVQLGDSVPDFSSLQSMLAELKGETGLPGNATFSIGAVGYDATTSKLSFGLGITRNPGSATNLDPFVAVDSGTGVHGTDTATGNPNLTDGSKNWKPDLYAGHLVQVAGASNVVKSNDATHLVFDGPWHGAAPSGSTGYQIGGQDAQIGAVSFANKLDQLATGSGIINANAQIPVATVTPSYTANLTVVLDLESPKLGTDCVGMGFNGTTNNQACPFTSNNPDGSSTVVTQLPTAADRVMVRTADSTGTPLHLLTADAPIHSQVDINANVGFLGLHLTGTLDECAQFSNGTSCPDPSTASTHLLGVDFASGLGDAQHDIPLSGLFSALASDPTSVVGVHVNGQVKASITPDVPGMSNFFGTTPPQFSLSMSDVTDPSSVTFDAGGFSTALDQIKAFNFDTSNPKALFGEVLQTLKTLSKFLKTVGGNSNSSIQSVLGTKIPIVGMKLGDVFASSDQGQGANVGYTDSTITDADAHFTSDLYLRTIVAGTSTGVIIATTPTSLTVRMWQGGRPAPGAHYQVENALDSAIDLLTASPADSLQSLVGLLNERLGASSVPIVFSVDTSGATPLLAMAIDWHRDFHFSTPVAFDFSLPSGAASIVGSQANGLVHLHATAEAQVKVLLPLSIGSEAGASDPGGLQIDPKHTSLSASVGADVGGYLKANFGPLSLSLGEPVTSNAVHPAEAHATFAASLGTSDTSPESVSDFLSHVTSGGIQFNQGAQAVSCVGDATPNMALCAALPVYLSTDGGQTYSPVNGTGPSDPPDTIRLRLPLSGDLGKEFALTDSGGSILHVDPTDNTSAVRLDIPPALLTDLSKSVLDFSQLGQGLDGYFHFAEQSLNLASFGGKLPLVGDDLQQGAQFLEKTQAMVDSKLGALASVHDEQGLVDWINNQLNQALAPVLPAGGKVTADFVCSATLDTPSGVAGAAANAGSGSTNYQYRVAATDPKGETVATSAVVVASQPLSGTNTVTLTWNKVDGAAGYHVYRSGDGGTSWVTLSAPQATNPTLTDTGGGSPAPAGTPISSGTNPAMEPCPITDITGVTLTADLGQGTITKDGGCVDGSGCIGDTGSSTQLNVPLNIGIPGLSISAANQAGGIPDPANELRVRLGWHIHLKVGLTKAQGFFVETQDQANPEIAVGVAVSLPRSIQANIAFLKVNLCDVASGQTYPPTPSSTCPFQPLLPNGVTRTPGADKPLFAGEIGIDLHTPTGPNAFNSTITPNDDPANNITLNDLADVSGLPKLVTVGLNARASIDWDFQALVTEALPGVGGEFKLDWRWGDVSGKAAVATETGTDATPPTDSNGAPNIEFDHVYLSAGGFLSGVLKPILKEVQSFTSPLKPVIDTLYAPIPVLSDLSHLAGGGDVSLVTIAEAYSTLAGGPDLTMVERILEVVKVISSIPVGDDNLGIFIGTFHVGANAINTSATPDNTNSLISAPTPAAPGDNGGKSAAGAMDQAAGGTVAESGAKGGFSFPILDKPASVFNLLMGGDIDLVRFDSGNLKLGFAYSQQFGPVYAPPPVLITISGSASVSARIIAGFDTYGLRKGFEAIQSGQRPSGVALSIVDSLFLYTVDPTKNDGKPIPVLTLQGELAAGAEVSVVIVSVGVEGGISLTINFYWNDPDNDGKFRSSEFLTAAQANPLCLFNTDGQLSVFLRVFVTIGIGPFSDTFSFTLVNITLLDFSYHPSCSPPPPELGELQNHTLYLFFGALGGNAQRGSPWGNDGGPNQNADETAKVSELHDPSGNFTGMAVDGLTRHEEFLDPSITTVVLDARGYAGKQSLVVTGDSDQTKSVSAGLPTPRPFDKTAIVLGGTNDDNIKIDGGTAYVDGGGGNDTINLANGNDYVAGGPGNDNITEGNGNDTIAGDGSLPVTSTVTLQDHRQVGSPTPQGSWSDIANVPNGVGAPAAGEASTDGNDAISVGYGASHIYGNGGDDSVNVATDTPLTGSQSRQPGINAAGNNFIVGGAGNNHIHSGTGDDTIYAGQQWTGASDNADPPNATGNSGDGINQVDSGSGSDTVYGGSSTDILVGHSTATGLDRFYGGGGGDVLVGGNGADQLFGGPGDDYLSGGPAQIDALSPADPVFGAWKVTPQPDGNPVAGKLLVGGDNNDHIYGAGSGDQIYGDRQEDHCVTPTSGPRSTPPAETNSGTPGADYIVGGNGDNSINGGGANDVVYAGTGSDVLCGGAGADTLYGGRGIDNMFGGSGTDLLVGGGGNSALYGNSGNDNIVGGSGNDWIEGNDGSDVIDGGSGQSLVIGGTSASGQSDQGDTIFGGPGNNIIIGDNGTVDPNPGWPASGAPFATPTVVHSYDLTADVPDNTTFGGNDTITGGTGNDQIYGGLGDDHIVGGTGVDHIEGGPGSDTIYGGSNNDDILGGTSPQAVAGGSVDGIPDGSDGHGNDVTPATLTAYSPVIGNTIYGFLPTGANGAHANVIVGGNGSITPTGAIDLNDGAPVRAVQQLALLSVGGNDTIVGGPGDDQIFGGLGDDQIHTGNANNYVEGGPGSDGIYGGSGSNDLIGGTSPLSLPTSGPDALSTSQVPDAGDVIYADGRTGPPPPNTPQDGSNVVLADNGCISRGTGGAPTDTNGCPTGPSILLPLWQYSKADPTSVTAANPDGALLRPVIRQLDVFDCPNTSCATPGVQGGTDQVWGGTGDDLLFGETGNDQVFGGPPGTNGTGGTSGTPVGNDYMEGGAGSDVMAGGAGDDDMIGGTAPTYLPGDKTTAMVSDGSPGGTGSAPAPPANPALSVPGSGRVGNVMDGGAGNDVMLGGNGSIAHVLSAGVWKTNPNDGAFVRTPVNLDLLTIGADDTMRGGPGDDRMFGGLGNDSGDAGTGADYVEGGPGQDVLQGGAGDDDIVGGTSPVALPPPPVGKTGDQVAADTPDGTADPANADQRLGNVVCGFYCGQSTTASDDDAIVANNGRVDRCPASVSNGVGTAQGNDACTWGRTSYGRLKAVSAPGTEQSGTLTTTPLGNARTRYVTLLGQSPTDSVSNGNDYVEGDSGNDVIWGGDGNDSIHGDTPAPNSPRLDECLPTSDATAAQDIIVGGYGNDTLCGDGGDDAIVGTRGIIKVVPFANGTTGPTVLGSSNGPTYGTLTVPSSGNTIYQADLSNEQVNGVLTAVPNWDNPAVTGQNNQHDTIFGGQGNDSIHGSPGNDFIQGDDGMHIMGQAPSTGGDDIVFGGGGNDSNQGGPGNDHLYGGQGNDDLDVIRTDTAVAGKVSDSSACLPVLFPTINVNPTDLLSAAGCPTSGYGLQSYASRFPLPAVQTYDTDPGALDNGGTSRNTNLFGDVLYGGHNRDVLQSQSTGFGDRLIDSYGAYNLEYVCPAAYGGWQIIRALSPTMLTFLEQSSQADGAINTATATSSGGSEADIVYPSEARPDNAGSAYPTTPGHFTC